MTSFVKLSGSQKQRLQDGLLDRFAANSLQQLLSFRLDVNLSTIVAPGALADQVFALIQTAEQEGWIADLLVAVSEARPGDPVFEKLKTELGVGKSVTPASSEALESFVDGVGGLLNPEVLRTKLAALEAAVCQITYRRPDGLTYGGTGFLVGPSTVMTNDHVMKYVTDGEVPPSGVKVLFDYKLDGDGQTVNQGNAYSLAPSWLVDHSPYSATDLEALPQVPDTALDELDYALVRLAEPVGCLPVPTNVPGRAGGVASGDAGRGWIKVPDQPAALAPRAPLFILQHPEIGMMKLAWDPDSVQAVNASRTRVRHATATLGGSSGSPCFDADFNLVALHHAGDPAATAELPATYNQAIPLPAIVDLLDKRGHADVLHEQCVGE